MVEGCGWSVRREGVAIGRKGVEGSRGKKGGADGSGWSVWRKGVESGRKGMVGRQYGAKDGERRERRYGRDRWT